MPSFLCIRSDGNRIVVDYSIAVLETVAHADLKRLAGFAAGASEAA